MQLAQERMVLHTSLDESEGEITQDILSQQEIIDTLSEIFESEGGIDAVGRYVKQSQDAIADRKAEKEYADRHLKAEENELAKFLVLVDLALRQSQKDKIKGSYGYSFSQHVSVSTKADNKMIKEMFYDKVSEAIKGVVPDDITFTLSASVSRLPEGAEKPEWYNTTSISKAIFRKPRKPQNEEEFTSSDFEL